MSSKILVDEIVGKTTGFASITNGLIGNSAIYGWNSTDTTSLSSATVTIANLSTTNYNSNGITAGANNRLIPTKAGKYFIILFAQASGTGSAAYKPATYIYKNGSSFSSRAGIRSFAGSCTLDFPAHMAIVSANGSSDYFQMAVWQNSGNTFSLNGGSVFMLRVGD